MINWEKKSILKKDKKTWFKLACQIHGLVMRPK
jgi:hypothetical protein